MNCEVEAAQCELIPVKSERTLDAEYYVTRNARDRCFSERLSGTWHRVCLPRVQSHKDQGFLLATKRLLGTFYIFWVKIIAI